jgi:hypothetical protein
VGYEDREEPNRVFGIPLRPPGSQQQGEESQRVLGFPVDWFGPANDGVMAWIAHPVREYRRWTQRHGRGAA